MDTYPQLPLPPSAPPAQAPQLPSGYPQGPPGHPQPPAYPPQVASYPTVYPPVTPRPAGQPRGGAMSGLGRAFAPLAAVLAAFGKYGIVLLKLGKLGPTLISMLLTIWVMAGLFGPAFGIGLVALIAVHEFGHLLFARYEGVSAGLPVFLGPFGAVIGLKQPLKDARQEAVIAIGGPVVGTMGAAAMLLLSQVAADGSYLHHLLLALAYFGFFINLFNLIPVTPLDGGRVASALSPWANVVGLVIVAALIVGPLSAGRAVNPFLVLILILGGIGTFQRFRARRQRPEYMDVPPSTRMWIGVAYAAMLAITAVGMSETHAALQVLNPSLR